MAFDKTKTNRITWLDWALLKTFCSLKKVNLLYYVTVFSFFLLQRTQLSWILFYHTRAYLYHWWLFLANLNQNLLYFNKHWKLESHNSLWQRPKYLRECSCIQQGGIIVTIIIFLDYRPYCFVTGKPFHRTLSPALAFVCASVNLLNSVLRLIAILEAVSTDMVGQVHVGSISRVCF